ncbi:MAG: GlxA family transcriptional regulator [Gammaproteobacteria bacterium]|nr:GlxA family transcriptional regulator [Gammaproteobacteria bacterium]
MQSPASTIRVGFLLVPDFGILGFASALDALRHANQIAGRECYRWILMSADGAPVQSSAGLTLPVDAPVDENLGLDIVLVIAGVGAEHVDDPRIISGLKRLSRRRITVGGVSLGSYLLARAGLLEGYRCTVHWENLSAFREEFPRLDVSDEVFELDRDRMTCSGGTASLDMMLQVITDNQGARLAAKVADACIMDRVRSSGEPQRMPLRLRVGVSHPKLLRAIELIEACEDRRQSQSQLAEMVGLSERQMERLFRKYLDTTPSRYARDYRLRRGRDLLRQTRMNVVDVAVACGFTTASHFTKSYREYFGVTPGDDRDSAAARVSPHGARSSVE